MILIGSLIVIFRRKNKIKYFDEFSFISSQIITSRIVVYFSLVTIYAGIEILIWMGMSKLYYIFTTIDNTQSTFNSIFVWIIFILFWLWLHGILIAISDYFTQSFTVYWFYSYRKNG